MTTTVEAIGLPFEEAIDFFRQKTRVPTRRWTDIYGEAHSRAFMVAGAATDDLLADFQAEIRRALETGSTLAAFRDRFDEIVQKHGWSHTGSPGWRSRIIYETNLSTAYSAGRYAQQSDPDVKAAFPYWTYVHSGSRHPRLNHLSWNGTTLSADDPWWKTHYPPNGWRCGCRVSITSRAGLRRMGKDGPDQAPPLDARPWTNPSTGETRQVPRGIDPGFDYNPGEAWLRRGPDRGPGPAAAPPPVVSIPATGAATPRQIAEFVRQPIGTIRVGSLPSPAMAELGTEVAEVLLSAETMEKQLERHGDLGEESYRALPEMLSAPAAALSWGADRVLLVARTGDAFHRIIVKATRDRSTMYVVSFHRIDANRLPALARRGRLLLGSLEE